MFYECRWHLLLFFFLGSRLDDLQLEVIIFSAIYFDNCYNFLLCCGVVNVMLITSESNSYNVIKMPYSSISLLYCTIINSTCNAISLRAQFFFYK